MNGNAVAYTAAEHVLGTGSVLVGCIIFAFMVGEIANVLGNLDPAGKVGGESQWNHSMGAYLPTHLPV